MLKAVVLLAAVAALALVTSSCGGAKSSTEDTTDFIARANAICEGTATEFQAFVQTHNAPTSEEIALVNEEGSKAFKSVIDQIDGLHAPSSLQEDVEAWLAGGRERLEIGKQRDEALRTGEQAVAARLRARMEENWVKGFGLSGDIGWSCGDW
jgi:hypothetical protein